MKIFEHSPMDYIMQFPNKILFFSLKIVFVSANSVDPDEMSHYAVCQSMHLGITSIQRVKVFA